LGFIIKIINMATLLFKYGNLGFFFFLGWNLAVWMYFKKKKKKGKIVILLQMSPKFVCVCVCVKIKINYCNDSSSFVPRWYWGVCGWAPPLSDSSLGRLPRFKNIHPNSPPAVVDCLRLQKTHPTPPQPPTKFSHLSYRHLCSDRLSRRLRIVLGPQRRGSHSTKAWFDPIYYKKKSINSMFRLGHYTLRLIREP